ncbi:MAG: haloalkane dehalogenase [Actinomycetota bacterium]|nr:haloalkane dehalogenase [Actinomycetota bacterium]
MELSVPQDDPILVSRGLRAVAPDLIGFGRSDKPASRNDYTYQRHLDWTYGLIESLDLTDVTLFCQDWGGLIGLRIAAEHPQRFARIVAANTFLPTGDIPLGDAFFRWQEHSQTIEVFDVGSIVSRGCSTPLEPDAVAAYDAPFPDESYKEGARQFPMLVPATPDDPAAPANRAAWNELTRWGKPFLTIFGADDPITRGADAFLQAAIPGAAGQSHRVLEGAGHFLQEDKGAEIAAMIGDFVTANQQQVAGQGR